MCHIADILDFFKMDSILSNHCIVFIYILHNVPTFLVQTNILYKTLPEFWTSAVCPPHCWPMCEKTLLPSILFILFIYSGYIKPLFPKCHLDCPGLHCSCCSTSPLVNLTLIYTKTTQFISCYYLSAYYPHYWNTSTYDNKLRIYIWRTEGRCCN